MSLIKLAYTPIIVVNNQGDTAGSSKTFSLKNAAAIGVGGVTGFAGKELIEHPKVFPKFDKLKMSHRLGSRMASVAGGFLGAATAYKLMKKKQDDSTMQMYAL